MFWYVLISTVVTFIYDFCEFFVWNPQKKEALLKIPSFAFWLNCRNHCIFVHRAYWTLKYSWLCSLTLWFLCFFSLYIIFNNIYKNLTQSLWWKHDHIATIVIWLRSGENQLGIVLFTDIFHQLSADLSTQYLQNREVVDIIYSKNLEFVTYTGRF